VNLGQFPRTRLAHLPTPLEPLPRLSGHLGGPTLFVKRDDCTGLAFGGNKTRKLEFALGRALADEADVILTAGPLQSNHARQTAAACAKLGLRCELVLSLQSGWHEAGYEMTANRLLDDLLGAHVHLVETEHDRPPALDRLARRFAETGERPFVVPAGASDAVGGLGYAAAAAELVEQLKSQGVDATHVVTATGSGGTQGGLVAGLASLDNALQVLGVDIDADVQKTSQLVLECASATAQLLGTEIRDERVVVIDGYAGSAYGAPTSEMRDAVRLAAELEGLILDPIYTGKAMAGLIDLVRRGRLSKRDTVVFLHTGGLPALFAYRTALTVLPPGQSPPDTGAARRP